MTAKEKARQLYNSYMSMPYLMHTDKTKYCMLITCDEIIKEFTNKCCEYQNKKFWEEVKKVIETTY